MNISLKHSFRDVTLTRLRQSVTYIVPGRFVNLSGLSVSLILIHVQQYGNHKFSSGLPICPFTRPVVTCDKFYV